MILIDKIHYYETERDVVEIIQNTNPASNVILGDDLVSMEFFTELVRGRRFVRPSDGTDVIVGLSSDSGNILGLMYEAWDNLERENNALSRENHALMQNANKQANVMIRAERAGFVERLKWLFFGYKPNFGGVG